MSHFSASQVTAELRDGEERNTMGTIIGAWGLSSKYHFAKTLLKEPKTHLSLWKGANLRSLGYLDDLRKWNYTFWEDTMEFAMKDLVDIEEGPARV